jgi:hypothetical protein
MGLFFQAIGNLLSNPISLIGAASPLIVNSIQSHKARLVAAETNRVAELSAATKLATEVTTSANQLAYLNQEAMYGVVYRKLSFNTLTSTAAEDDKQAWKAFRTEWNNWMSEGLVRQSSLSIHFGPAAERAFSQINLQVELLTNMVNAGFFQRTDSRYYIEDVMGSDSQSTLDSWSQSYLVSVLGIDKEQLPTLFAYVTAERPGSKAVIPQFQNDFRLKYNPVRENLVNDIIAFSRYVLSKIQTQQVGNLRQTNPAK